MIQTKSSSRRSFLKWCLLSGSSTILGKYVNAAESRTDVWVIHGNDKILLMDKCLEIIGENGGLASGTMALKVNAAWSRTPEQGANTHPVLVDRFLQGVKNLGITESVLPEHACQRGEQTFERSGILQVAKKNKTDMIDMQREQDHFVEVSIPSAVTLKQAQVPKELIEADVIVNMPVAKDHRASILTIAMKNWMGSVNDRGVFHRENLHQCIADISSFFKPSWTIVDATRIMMDKGPQGPTSNMRYPNLLVVSRDQVAADVFTSTLFYDDPMQIGYLNLARKMNLGETDLNKMSLHRIEA